MYSFARFCIFVLGAVGLAGCVGSMGPSASSSLPNSLSVSATRGVSVPSLVFVADRAASAVFAYPAGVDNPKPVETITDGISKPLGVATDAAGSVFVVNSGAGPRGNVTAYKTGSLQPYMTFVPDTTFLLTGGIAVAADDSMYLVGSSRNASEVRRYPAGASKPSFTIYGGTQPGITFESVFVDRQSDVYVSFSGGACCGSGLLRYVPNSHVGRALFNGLIGGIAADTSGDILASLAGKGVIRVYAPDGHLTHFGAPPAGPISFDSNDSLLYTTFGTVTIVNYATKTRFGSIRGIFDATGIAVSPNSY